MSYRKSGGAGKIIGGILIGILSAVLIGFVVVGIASLVNDCSMAEQITTWFGNSTPVIEETVDVITKA